MKIDCDISQDLLPLYVENMVSNKTQEVIKEHLNECEICKNKYSNMIKKDMDVSFHDISKLKIFKNHIVVIIILSILIQVISSLVYCKIFFYGNIIRITLMCLYLFTPLIAFLCSWRFSRKNIGINIITIFFFGIFGGLMPLTLTGIAILSVKVISIFVAYTLIPAVIGVIVGKVFMCERKKQLG